MNLLDRAIAYIAPAAAARRAFARAQIGTVSAIERMQYDGASLSWRTVGKRISSASANAEIAWSLGRLRDVHRHLVRNNPFAANVNTVIPAHVVGAGIIPSFTVSGVRLKKKLQDVAKAHLDTLAIDYDGRQPLAGLLALTLRTVVESGEALLVRYVPPATLRLPVPLQVRLLEPDYLDSSKDGDLGNGSFAFQGIEFDSSGRRVAYWIFDKHPGGDVGLHSIPVSRRIPAGDVIHVFRQDRPGQMRGIPWGAPCIMTMWDLADYEDAELMRQKIAACFSVFLTGAADRNLGQQLSGEKTKAGTDIEKVEPGLIKKLPAGVEVSFATPPAVTGYPDFVRTNARKIACGYGVPYEIATNDLSQVSFISGRMGMLQFNRSVDQWRWNMLIPHACGGIGLWFLHAAGVALGAALDDAVIDWTPPRREMIEPGKEIIASRDAIRSGLTSRSEELRSLGLDPEAIDQEQAADNARADGLNLGFDSDGRRPVSGPKEKGDGKKSAD